MHKKDSKLLSALQSKDKKLIKNDLEINLFQEYISKYHQILHKNPISPNAHYLFFCILQRSVRLHHTPLFFIKDKILESLSGLSNETFISARKELITLRLIEYKPGIDHLSIKAMYRLL